ncbi:MULTISPECIES: DUF484 family protein [Methylococcus]|jgi:uncharacterized protein YigA (DUF484 family)|uniref:DUF484 family protein n=1 Tax=Methylococcus capsulatus TaxID=414 RepID=A0AA35UIP5_METCP|nr:DUF484 family protein [Methylococcus capsulatus]CAI8740629.1 conserved protein of unknown function [Methylococcus capsulatus]
MNFGKARRTERAELSASQVADYLWKHPDFFHDQLDLLESMHVPHPCGEAVSLVARQIELLRGKNRKQQGQLNDILRIARENDALFARFHRLTLTLLDAASVDDMLAGLKWSLHEGFQADFVSVRVFRTVAHPAVGDLHVMPDPAVSILLEPLLASCEPVCGSPPEPLLEFLFGADAPDVASCALVPLCHAGIKGLLAIGSFDAGRFTPEMGNLFLVQMGEIVAARLVALIDRER